MYLIVVENLNILFHTFVNLLLYLLVHPFNFYVYLQKQGFSLILLIQALNIYHQLVTIMIQVMKLQVINSMLRLLNGLKDALLCGHKKMFMQKMFQLKHVPAQTMFHIKNFLLNAYQPCQRMTVKEKGRLKLQVEIGSLPLRMTYLFSVLCSSS